MEKLAIQNPDWTLSQVEHKGPDVIGRWRSGFDLRILHAQYCTRYSMHLCVATEEGTQRRTGKERYGQKRRTDGNTGVHN